MPFMSRRQILAGSAAGAGLATIGSARRAAAQASGPIRIGYQLPLSGPVANIGLQCKAGAETAADYVNRNGGVLGRPVEIVFKDTKANPNEAVIAARELTSAGINLIGSGFIGFDILGSLPIIEETKSLAISMTTVSMAVTHEKFSRRVFRQNSNDYQATSGAAAMAAARYPDVTVWGSIGYNAAATKDSVFNFQVQIEKAYARIGKKITLVEPMMMKIGTTDFKNEISSLMSQGVQGLFSEVYGEGGVTLFQQASSFGFSKQVKVIIDVGNEYAFARGMGKNIPNNFWAYTHWNPAIYPNNVLGQALGRAYTERTKDPYPGQFLYYGSTPVLIFAAAIKAANGSTDTDRLIDLLEGGLKVETIQGPISFRKEDHAALGDLSFIKFDPIATDPGFAVTDSVTIKGADVLEPATPGVAFKF